MSAVRVALLHTMAEMERAADLLRDVWGGSTHPVQAALLRAQAHAGNYVAGAFVDDRLVGASMGFLADPDDPVLHSHITGVAPAAAGRGVGRRLKEHQAAWCRARGITTITWTFDPLVARNAWFNLSVLGVAVRDYLVDFYGDMPDARNRGQGSDRLLVAWDVAEPGRAPRPPRRGDDIPLVLAVGPDAEPAPRDPPADAAAVRLAIPRDVEAIRRDDPDRAIRWRHALRAGMAPRLGVTDPAAPLAGHAAAAWRVVGFDRDGCWVLARR